MQEDEPRPAKLLRLSRDALPPPPLELLGHMTPLLPPSTVANVTLFQWQVQQEEQRMGGVPPELLNSTDGDGDT